MTQGSNLAGVLLRAQHALRSAVDDARWWSARCSNTFPCLSLAKSVFGREAIIHSLMRRASCPVVPLPSDPCPQANGFSRRSRVNYKQVIIRRARPKRGDDVALTTPSTAGRVPAHGPKNERELCARAVVYRVVLKPKTFLSTGPKEACTTGPSE